MAAANNPPPSVLGLATHTTAEQPQRLTLDRVVHCLQALLGDAPVVPQHTPVVIMVAFERAAAAAAGVNQQGDTAPKQC